MSELKSKIKIDSSFHKMIGIENYVLCIQIEEETLKFAKKLGIRTVAVIGGVRIFFK